MPYSEEHKQETRQKILESARRLFNRKGFTEVSIEEVMESAGLTHGGFYRHFRGKAELYAEAVRWFLCTEAPKPWQRKPAAPAGAHKPRGKLVDCSVEVFVYRICMDITSGQSQPRTHGK